MKYLVLGASLMMAAPAFAQQQPPTPNEQALSGKLLKEMQDGLSCSVNLITAQNELAKANARLKELEALKEKPKGAE